MDLKISAILIPKFKLDWVEDNIERKELTEIFKLRLQTFCDNVPANSDTSATDYFKDSTITDGIDDNFYIFRKKRAKIEQPHSSASLIAENYLFTDNYSSVKQYPSVLKRAFIRYNTTVPSSAHVERLFSAGGLVYDDLRGKMTDYNFEMTLLLKFNKYF